MTSPKIVRVSRASGDLDCTTPTGLDDSHEFAQEKCMLASLALSCPLQPVGDETVCFLPENGQMTPF